MTLHRRRFVFGPMKLFARRSRRSPFGYLGPLCTRENEGRIPDTSRLVQWRLLQAERWQNDAKWAIISVQTLQNKSKVQRLKSSNQKGPFYHLFELLQTPHKSWRRTDRPNNLDPSMSLLTLAHSFAQRQGMQTNHIYPSYPSNYLIILLLSIWTICIYLSYLVILITGHCMDKRRIETKETPTIFWNLLPVWVHHHSILDSQNMFRVTIIPHSIESILLYTMQSLFNDHFSICPRNRPRENHRKSVVC